MRNCIVQNNQPQASNTFNTAPGFLYTYTCVYPAVAGIGNITNDPQIVISDDGRFPLAPTSPCIDTGTNIAGVTRDWAGVPRPLDGNADGTARADMGAFEFVNTGADSDGDGMPDGWELGHGLNPVTNDAGGDADVDAFANLAEYVAGTDPGDATARLSVVRVDALPTGLVLDWDSASNRLYTVEARPQWNAAWSNASAILPGTGSALSYTSSIPDATGLFYRIRVALPPVP